MSAPRSTRRRLAALLPPMVAGALQILGGVVPLLAQVALSADGAVESRAGGFVFPDGTRQLTAVPDAPAPVPATFQRTCFSPTGVGSLDVCGGSGQDGEHQTGMGWPSHRFVDQQDGTVLDRLTDLVWLQDRTCESGDWEAVLSAAAALADGSCGLTDGSMPGEWRVPTVRELQSLVHFDRGGPDEFPFDLSNPFVLSDDDVWSSTSFAGDPREAFRMEPFNGLVEPAGKTSGGALWAVRQVTPTP